MADRHPPKELSVEDILCPHGWRRPEHGGLGCAECRDERARSSKTVLATLQDLRHVAEASGRTVSLSADNILDVLGEIEGRDKEIERLTRELAMSDAGGNLALAERDRLRSALTGAQALLRHATSGSTHWDTCFLDHPVCGALRAIDQALAGKTAPDETAGGAAQTKTEYPCQQHPQGSCTYTIPGPYAPIGAATVETTGRTNASMQEAPMYHDCTECENYKRLARELATKQARIDALMLEHCPDEMTPEQLAEWARHQQPAARCSTLCAPDEPCSVAEDGKCAAVVEALDSVSDDAIWRAAGSWDANGSPVDEPEPADPRRDCPWKCKPGEPNCICGGA
jgi:hypothetical protein